MNKNKNRLVDEPAYPDNAVVLDYLDSKLVLQINDGLNPSDIWIGRLYKLRLKRYLDFENSTERIKWFKCNLSYITFKKIIDILFMDSQKRGYKFYVLKRLSEFIESKEMFIYERANAGLLIKQHSDLILDKFNKYKEIVNKEMARPLREQQMWDSFFMCSMKRVSNFSVPGSGKTASVYGVYAYLKSQGLVNRIVMIGPKNSFGSWVDEFTACFGDKQKLNVFNIQSEEYKSLSDKQRAILFNTGQKNLLLFNYEGIGGYANQLKTIINDKTLLVMDEIHKVKLFNNDMGSRAQNVFNVSENAKYTIALTGTPIPNSYIDIYNLLHILYRDEYDDFFGFEPKQLKNPDFDDIENINEKLQPFYCRTTKKQLNVPDSNDDIIIRSEASDKENELFNILIQKYRKNKLTLMIRLLQLESSPQMLLKNLELSDFKDILDLSGDIDDIDYVDYSDDVKNLINSIDKTQKFSACITKAKELYSQGKKIIIWCIFVDSIHRISTELEKNGIKVGCIFGGITLDERNSILSQFKAGDLDILITNPHTLAESVSLHGICHDAIYFEYSYNLVHLLQSKDRIHRLGLPDGQYTQYYYLQQVYKNDSDHYSIDEQIYDRLNYKEQVMLNAIEKNEFEEVTTPEEDLNIIFESLKL